MAWKELLPGAGIERFEIRLDARAAREMTTYRTGWANASRPKKPSIDIGEMMALINGDPGRSSNAHRSG